ncbi:MAG: hypothetical protein N4A40_12855 [Tissierellales bacterium]|nr:hypothetical protein [Tissierellales bacterium]
MGNISSRRQALRSLRRIDMQFLEKTSKYLSENLKDNYNREYIPMIVQRLLYHNFDIKTQIYQGSLYVIYHGIITRFPTVFNVYKGKVIDLQLSFFKRTYVEKESLSDDKNFVQSLPDFYYSGKTVVNIPGVEKIWYGKEYKISPNKSKLIDISDIDNVDTMILSLYNDSYLSSMSNRIKQTKI